MAIRGQVRNRNAESMNRPAVRARNTELGSEEKAKARSKKLETMPGKSNQERGGLSPQEQEPESGLFDADAQIRA